jgi:chromosome segregation ATPase
MDGRQGESLDEKIREEMAEQSFDLVERTEQLIRATEDHATELAQRSAAALAHLQEEIRLAERVLEAAETRRRVAEAEVKDLSEKLETAEKSFQESIDSLTNEFKASFEETERAYQGRIETLTAERDGLQKRALSAEERVEKAEQALVRVQKTLQGILQIRTPSPDLTSSSKVRMAAAGQ